MERPVMSSAGGADVAPASRLGTIVLEAGEAVDRLARKLDSATIGMRAGRHGVIVVCPRGREAQLRERLPERFRAVEIGASETWWANPRIETPWVAFLPAAAVLSPPRWDLMPERDGFVRPWLPQLIPTTDERPVIYEPATAWVAATSLLPQMFDETSSGFGLATVVE